MMHADLIDQHDLLNQLRSLGFEVSGSADEACKAVVCGLNDTNVRALKGLVEKLYSSSATILPAVREAIDQHMLPGLAQFKYPSPHRSEGAVSALNSHTGKG